MNSARLLCAVSFVASMALSACARRGHEQGTPLVLATVNGAPITADDLSVKLGDHDMADPTIKGSALDAVIAEELMFQQAVKLGFDKDSKFQERIRAMEAKITAYRRAEMGRRVRDTQIASHVTVTDQEVRDYYEKNSEDIRTDLRLGVLQFGDVAHAHDALARIRSGTPFETIAAEQFPDASNGASRAWDRGFQPWDRIPEALEGVHRLKKGEVDALGSGPSKTYLVKVIDTRQNPNGGFEEVKASVERKLWAVKGREAYERYVAQLKKDAAITMRGGR